MRAVLDTQRALQQAICADRADSADSAAPPLLRRGSRLDVYRQAYRARLSAALRDNYEVLHRAMGDDAFEALARAYIEAHPSSHASIRWFGDRLAAYMQGYETLPHPALIDFARMDWALRSAFDGPDSEPLAAAAFGALAAEDWATLRLTLRPTVVRVPLTFSIEPAWSALRGAASAQALPEVDAPAPLTHSLLVWRRGLETRWRSLEPLEAALLEAVQAGEDFSALCERAAAEIGAPAAAGATVQALHQWLADGILSGPLQTSE